LQVGTNWSIWIVVAINCIVINAVRVAHEFIDDIGLLNGRNAT